MLETFKRISLKLVALYIIMRKILISGAYGQLGQELFIGLSKKFGA